MQVGSVRGFWDRGWLPTVAAKSSYFHAVAQYQLGLASQAQKSFGEAVARMKVSEVCFLCVGVRVGEGGTGTSVHGIMSCYREEWSWLLKRKRGEKATSSLT